MTEETSPACAVGAESPGEMCGDTVNTDSGAPRGDALKESMRWIVWYLRRLAQAGERFNKELFKKYQVSQPQLTCLLALHEYGSLPISKLAKYVLVGPSTVTGIVDRLEQHGLVVRKRTEADRRVITIELTPEGLSLVSEAPLPIPLSIVEGLVKLPPNEIGRIVESLATLARMLDKDSADSSLT